MIPLVYWRDYHAYGHAAYDYSVRKTTIGNAVLFLWVENTLIPSGACNLQSVRELRETLSTVKTAVVDGVE
ncbi:MAG: hypothetical protein GX786_07255 [Clostridiales bacterium]|nr:hypothetical protein [Clostridiales bacterium]